MIIAHFLCVWHKMKVTNWVVMDLYSIQGTDMKNIIQSI